MNVALIIAGGTGMRMNQDIPKQFISIYDKPVIVYTMEVFQKHPNIDGICVVCLDGWLEILKTYAKQFGIGKLNWVVPGGATSHKSIENGIAEIGRHCDDSTIVLIHDAIRPMVTTDMISDCIAKCNIYGNGVASLPCLETVMTTNDKISSTGSIPRDTIMRMQTPQAYRLKELKDLYAKAKEMGITDSVYTNVLMEQLGKKVYFSIGSEKNIKLTTIEDIEIFKALLNI